MGVCLANCSPRAVIGALVVSLGAAAHAADPRPAFAADCEPAPDVRLAAFQLQVDGKVRVARTQPVPADRSILVLVAEHKTDARLEVLDPMTKVMRWADSPMRRWGPQRVL